MISYEILQLQVISADQSYSDPKAPDNRGRAVAEIIVHQTLAVASSASNSAESNSTSVIVESSATEAKLNVHASQHCRWSHVNAHGVISSGEEFAFALPPMASESTSSADLAAHAKQ